MSNTDLHETLKAIGRSSKLFYRDTPMLLKTLDNLEEMNRRVKDIGRVPDRRIKNET